MDPDQVVAKLVGVGFKLSDFTNSVEVVGPSIDGVIDYLLDDSRRNTASASTSTACFSSRAGMLEKRGSSSSSCSAGKIWQSSINEFIQSAIRPKRSKTMNKLNMSQSEVLQRDTGGQNVHPPLEDSDLHVAIVKAVSSSYYKDEDIGPDWQKKVKNLLQQHFGLSLLKDFQKEALEAWLFHQDCLFLQQQDQILALLTGKVVIVISLLINLMHDQCLKLAKHGVSACFIGSCQTDRNVEQKAMAGMYSIIYVFPETILRLIKLLQSLAESHGIALVAVREVHCVSKWGHDFPPDYRYGMNTSCYRAKTHVEYFGEHLLLEIYLMCDICINGPPERQNLKAEAMIILQVVATHCRNFADISYGGYEGKLGERPNIKALVSKIREQQQFSVSDLLWWRGLARLWEVEGFIREGDDMIKYPEVTERGRQFLSSET